MVPSRLPSSSAAAGLLLATVGVNLASAPARAQAVFAASWPALVVFGEAPAGEDSGEEPEDLPEVEAADAFLVQAAAPALPRPGLPVALEPGAFSQDLAASLDAAPGARALRAGGELAPAELRVRGLGGPRLRVLLDGVALDDPAGGQLDLGEISSELLQGATLRRGPEAGSLAPGAVAGALELRTARPRPGLHARLRAGLGSEQTALLASRLGYGSNQGSLGLALTLGASSGNYSYRTVSYSGDRALVGEPQERLNNDHRRASLIATASHEQAPVVSRALVQVSSHQGGLAGLAGQPTPLARQDAESQLAGWRGLLETPLALLSMQLSGRHQRTRHAQPQGLQPLASDAEISSIRAILSGSREALMGVVDLDLGVETSHASARLRAAPSAVELSRGGAAQEASRLAAAAVGRARVLMLQRRLAADLGLRLDALSDLGLEPSASLRLAASLRPGLVAEAYAGRAFRAPTFVELYGPPTGYVRANPALRPEDGVELGALLRAQAPRLEVELALFGARLRDTILYLNRNAYEVRPENAGALWRGGGELLARVQATRYWSHSVAAELLLSRLDVTRAALPATPALVLQTRSQLALERAWPRLPVSGFADLRAHSETSSNLHGGLRVPAQAVLDLGLAWSPAAQASLALELRNALDADTRVDLRQVPLPGRQVRLTLVLEV